MASTRVLLLICCLAFLAFITVNAEVNCVDHFKVSPLVSGKVYAAVTKDATKKAAVLKAFDDNEVRAIKCLHKDKIPNALKLFSVGSRTSGGKAKDDFVCNMDGKKYAVMEHGGTILFFARMKLKDKTDSLQKIFKQSLGFIEAIAVKKFPWQTAHPDKDCMVRCSTDAKITEPNLLNKAFMDSVVACKADDLIVTCGDYDSVKVDKGCIYNSDKNPDETIGGLLSKWKKQAPCYKSVDDSTPSSAVPSAVGPPGVMGPVGSPLLDTCPVPGKDEMKKAGLDD